MKKIIYTFILIASVFGVLNMPTVRAADPRAQKCQDSNGVWTDSTGNNARCVCPTGNRANSEGTCVAVPVAKNCSSSFLGLPTWYKYLVLDASCTVVGPSVVKDDGTTRLDMTKVITRVSLAVIDILMRVGGMVAFAFIVISGFKFTMSQGNADQEKSARETAINAVIGMVITIFAIGIVTYIGNTIST